MSTTPRFSLKWRLPTQIPWIRISRGSAFFKQLLQAILKFIKRWEFLRKNFYLMIYLSSQLWAFPTPHCLPSSHIGLLPSSWGSPLASWSPAQRSPLRDNFQDMPQVGQMHLNSPSLHPACLFPCTFHKYRTSTTWCTVHLPSRGAPCQERALALCCYLAMCPTYSINTTANT